jgi:predicted 2-oxoglutarate/Fe(II)-dependent dioxygenase YbiX
LWDSVDNLIKNNLNNNHYLSKWIIVLRYDIGDYFNPHTDNPNPSDTDDRSLSGGIELSNKDDFDGGEYIVRDINNPFERGKLFTHKLTELHEITKVTKGTRWSLHFGIHKSKTLF